LLRLAGTRVDARQSGQKQPDKNIKSFINQGRLIMTKQKLLRGVSAVALGLTMVTGVGVASAHSYHNNNGGDSVQTTVKNDNDVKVRNNNTQVAKSGKAEVERNRTGGSAETGDVENKNALKATLIIDNGSCGCADDSSLVDGDGNSTKVTTKVTNDNDVHVTNNNDQYAKSGDAEVEHNGTGGDATTGGATNGNATEVNITVGN
jgi:cytoskeletal protein RodZ